MMIGVVVWASGDRHKAVIWCEDQGALAYLQGVENLAQPMNWPIAGDLLELETRLIGDLRHAFDVRLITESWCPDLPEKLRETQPMRCNLKLVSSQPQTPPETRAKLVAAN